ncbi:amidohydrolase family protein [Weissella cibaria]|uniref:Imidazolonepropionase n=1 Tax=Weissella cibaria TaxID=137591 RepID=A0A0D1M0L6_9LACO|nr:amidohydrolase family protein [Weissella cibaria]KIU25565.1 imidazolonepropionase [Weissella cibaria]
MSIRTYHNAQVYDVAQAKFIPNSWFSVDLTTGRITATGSGATPADAQELVDLNNKFITPGMINTHVHIINKVFPYGPKASREPFEIAMQAQANLNEMLASGVTYTRVLATAQSFDIGMQKMTLNGQWRGTGVVASGRAFSKIGEALSGPEEFRAGVRRRIEQGAHAIKYMASGGIAFDQFEQPDMPQMTEAEMAAGVDVAHRRGIKVAAHAEALQTVKEALRAGVDSVEHAFVIDDEALELFQSTGTYLTPTLVAPYVIIKRGDGLLPQWMVDKAYKWVDSHFAAFGKAAKNGVNLALGTDAGSPLNGYADTALEAELWTIAGATNAQILQALFTNAADFVVFDASPLADIKVLQEPKRVAKFGEFVDTTGFQNPYILPLDKGHLAY